MSAKLISLLPCLLASLYFLEKINRKSYDVHGRLELKESHDFPHVTNSSLLLYAI